MTVRQRLINAIRGEETDRTPWSPFLAYYWEHLPPEESACGQLKYLQAMGADPLLRGFNKAYRVDQKNVTVSERREGNRVVRVFETKVGNLTEVQTYSETGKTWFLTGHPVETEEDFKVLQYMHENMTVEEEIASCDRMERELGESALCLSLLGVHSKTSFQSLVEHWCGTENLIYALYDFPEVVEECLAVMQEKDMETVRASVESIAEAFIFWEDSSTTNISPDLFNRYTAPELNEWGRLLHANDKLLIHHACGHLKDLIPCMCKTEIDMIESISPPPTGNVDIQDAAALMPDDIGLIGGIEPAFFLKCGMEELETRVRYLLDVMKGKRFVLANSDSCPPGVSYEKFLLVSDLVRR